MRKTKLAPTLAITAPTITTTKEVFNGEIKNKLTPQEAKNIILDTPYLILSYIENDNFNSLGILIHPRYGLNIGGYNFKPEQIQKAGHDTTTYPFNTGAASGLPTISTIKNFIKEQISAEQGRFINTKEVYYNEFRDTQDLYNSSIDDYGPKVIEVEYYYPGTDYYAGHDYSSLQLLFLPHDDEKWYMVGIVNRFWTP